MASNFNEKDPKDKKNPKDDSSLNGFSSDDSFELDPDELEKIAGGWNGEYDEYDTIYY